MTTSPDPLTQLVQSPWFGIAGFVVGILGIVLSILFFFLAKKTRRLSYSTRNFSIVNDFVSKIRSLEIRYASQKVENLTASRVVFWNAGNETLVSKDIATADKLRIQLKRSCKILKVEVVHVSRAVNLFDYELDSTESAVPIKFEFLDKNDGGIIQIVHTGRSGEDIQILGTIMGIGKLSYIRHDGEFSSTESYGISFGIAIYSTFAAMVYFYYMVALPIFSSLLDKVEFFRSFYLIAYLTVPPFIFSLITFFMRSLNKLPKSLRTFREESWRL